MPWNNQSGGPWGAGGKNPTPPDLEELLRRGQDKLRAVLPGGNLGSRGIALIALVAVAIWGFSGFFRVDPDELGVVLRFGKYVRDANQVLATICRIRSSRYSRPRSRASTASTSACAAATTCAAAPPAATCRKKASCSRAMKTSWMSISRCFG